MTNLARVQQIYAAFSRGDVPTILEHMDERAEWEYGINSTDVPWLQPRKERGEVPQFFESLGALERHNFQPKILLKNDGVVIALILALVLAIGAVVFALQNPGYTDLQFGLYHLNASTALILICAITFGAIIGSLAMVPGRRKMRKEVKHLKQTLRDVTKAKEPETASSPAHQASEISV